MELKVKKELKELENVKDVNSEGQLLVDGVQVEQNLVGGMVTVDKVRPANWQISKIRLADWFRDVNIFCSVLA